MSDDTSEHPLDVVGLADRLTTTNLAWDDSCRLVPSRFPPVGLYDRVADAADLPTAFAIESLTNPRLRQEAGDLSIVPEHERVSGPGTTPIMAAFTHLNPAGSRFSDGTYGVYYAASDLETAAAEVGHHRAVFLGHTQEPAIEFDLRNYRATIIARLTELRGTEGRGDATMDAVYAQEDYSTSQVLGRRLREADSPGIAYDSVRRKGGHCVALFKPRTIVPPVRQGEHISLVWDGARISGWYLKSEHHPI